MIFTLTSGILPSFLKLIRLSQQSSILCHGWMSHLGHHVLRCVRGRTEVGGNPRAHFILLTVLEALTAGRVDVVTLYFYSLLKFSPWSLETTVHNRWLIDAMKFGFITAFLLTFLFWGSGCESFSISDINFIINHVVILWLKSYNRIIRNWPWN